MSWPVGVIPTLVEPQGGGSFPRECGDRYCRCANVLIIHIVERFSLDSRIIILYTVA